MKLFALSLVSLILLSGCGGGGTTSSSSNQVTPPGTYLNISGNWSFFAQPTQRAIGNFYLNVDLASTQGSVSGIAHILNDFCYGDTTNIPLSGTIDTQGNIKLVSAAVSSQVLTIKAATTTGTSLTSGSYSDAGGCDDADYGPMTGNEYGSITGTYSGNIRSGSTGGIVSPNLAITETTTPDSNGYFRVSGSATLSGESCFSSATIANPTTDTTVLGEYVDMIFTAPNGEYLDLNGLSSSDGSTFTVTSYRVYGGTCSDSGAGMLLRY